MAQKVIIADTLDKRLDRLNHQPFEFNAQIRFEMRILRILFI